MQRIREKLSLSYFRQKRYQKSVEQLVKGLNQEREETRQMMQTFFKVLTQKLPKGRAPEDHEVRAAVEQLKDVHKMAGLLVLAITPGSVVTLPALAAVGKRFGVDIMPSAFQQQSEPEDEAVNVELEVDVRVDTLPDYSSNSDIRQ